MKVGVPIVPIFLPSCFRHRVLIDIQKKPLISHSSCTLLSCNAGSWAASVRVLLQQLHLGDLLEDVVRNKDSGKLSTVEYQALQQRNEGDQKSFEPRARHESLG